MYWTTENYHFIYNIRTKEIVAFSTSSEYAKAYLNDRGMEYMMYSFTSDNLTEELEEIINYKSEYYDDNPYEIVGMGPCLDFMVTTGEELIVCDYAEQLVYKLRATFTNFMKLQERFLKTPEEERLNDKTIEDFLNYLDGCEDENGETSLDEVDIYNLVDFNALGKYMIEMGLIN